jgi:hypothetical protein
MFIDTGNEKEFKKSEEEGSTLKIKDENGNDTDQDAPLLKRRYFLVGSDDLAKINSMV